MLVKSTTTPTEYKISSPLKNKCRRVTAIKRWDPFSNILAGMHDAALRIKLHHDICCKLTIPLSTSVAPTLRPCSHPRSPSPLYSAQLPFRSSLSGSTSLYSQLGSNKSYSRNFKDHPVDVGNFTNLSYAKTRSNIQDDGTVAYAPSYLQHMTQLLQFIRPFYKENT